jgi:hypothetical protein
MLYNYASTNLGDLGRKKIPMAMTVARRSWMLTDILHP